MSGIALSSRNFIHPFPARMAPELALREIETLPPGSFVADPMMGSGTVLLAANQLGHRAVGSDLDPLAVLISKVSNTALDYAAFAEEAAVVAAEARNMPRSPEDLTWIGEDAETLEFVHYWFAEKQRDQLASLCYALQRRNGAASGDVHDAIRVALSRLIVTKEMKASLARDTSHSRPHRVALENSFDVYEGFTLSVFELEKRHRRLVRNGVVTVTHGDARDIQLPEGSCDALITSPPYLNAIDYLRGHRMALVWLGYTMGQLRKLRSNSVGAERSLTSDIDTSVVESAFGDTSHLGPRYRSIIRRYASDLMGIAGESHRVIKSGGKAVFVIGNSCLRGVYVDNAKALQTASKIFGLELIDSVERDIPERSRYLPLNSNGGDQLGKRMRTEVVLTFRKN